MSEPSIIRAVSVPISYPKLRIISKISADCSSKILLSESIIRVCVCVRLCVCVVVWVEGGTTTGANNHIWSHMIGIRCWQQFLAIVREYYSSLRLRPLIISHCEVVYQFSTVRFFLQAETSLYWNVSVWNYRLWIILKVNSGNKKKKHGGLRKLVN